MITCDQGLGLFEFINLFGARGSQNTLSGGGEQGTLRLLNDVGEMTLVRTPETPLNDALLEVFGLATAWRVALLIDKVGVFLVVALFLRNVAYQVRRPVHEDAPDTETFDKALSPHIYVEPYFDELSLSAKVGKAGVELEQGGAVFEVGGARHL